VRTEPSITISKFRLPVARVPGYSGQFLPPHTQFITSPQYVSQMPQANMPFNNAILEKHEALDNRWNILGIIESQINNFIRK
jgi:hypothetical protein